MGKRETYKERLSKLFDEVGESIGLQKEDRNAFIDWASERHTRLRQRDKEWRNKNSPETNLPLCDEYFTAVFEALKNCAGIDYYTGDELNWKITLADKQAGTEPEKKEAASTEKRQERVTFDHINGRNLTKLKFVVCAGKTNDAKNDLTQDEFVKLCRAVVAFADEKQSLSSDGL